MKVKRYILIISVLSILSLPFAVGAWETDVIKTKKGALKITFIGHASLCMEYMGMVIHVDPVSQYGDYTRLPKGDVILVTHEHFDHFDPRTIDIVKKKGTLVIGNVKVGRLLSGVQIMRNGEEKVVAGIKITAVPAYNVVNFRSPGVPYHPKGEGNGYILNFDGTRVYIAGDTENTPEMKALKGIDIAFLPMNLPYTMSPEMVADAARAFRPRILYPYHYGDTDVGTLIELMKSEKDIEVRIRAMK